MEAVGKIRRSNEGKGEIGGRVSSGTESVRGRGERGRATGGAVGMQRGGGQDRGDSEGSDTGHSTGGDKIAQSRLQAANRHDSKVHV